MENERKALASSLGIFFVIIVAIVFTFGLGAAIYSLIIEDYSGLIASIIFVIFNYIVFARKVFRLKTITFDKDYFYFKDNSKIGWSQIKHIENGKITYHENDSEKIVYFNPYFPSKNHKLFIKYCNSRKQKSS